MGKKIRLNEIAKELNMSPTTVSRALSGTGRISSKTRQKVLAYAEEVDYRSPSQNRQQAKKTSSSRSGNIAIVLSKDLLYESEFFHLCLLGATSALADHGYETLLILCNTNEYGALMPAVEKRKLDGVIFTRAIAHEKSFSYLKKNHIPIVVVGSGVKDALMVDTNTALACRELSSSLVNSGCRNIAYIGGSMNYNVNAKRLEGVLMGIS
ncbi:LacI family DNA-binding transcriptional regulator, partial [Butyrivibrio sp.]|uniref:LacI family DNA-binding transcriptional regulator n=1 Tax=Butyrivibrio sp. TaxID=28121 RepID=UPI0025B9374A